MNYSKKIKNLSQLKSEAIHGSQSQYGYDYIKEFLKKQLAKQELLYAILNP